MPLLDTLQRPLRDLRISVTDRCNFRCTYCMPREVFGSSFKYLNRSELLSFEEIFRLGRVFVRLGVEKIRLTGGEPLLRRSLPDLVAKLTAIDGLRDLSLTTNGALLRGQAEPLHAAGLRRITVSLDSLKQEVFRTMNDTQVPLSAVLDGIEAAKAVGFSPIKINMMVRKGVNDSEVEVMAGFCRQQGLTLRFIEFMDVGNSNRWRREEVVPSRDVIRRLNGVFGLEAVEPSYRGEVATRYRYADGGGEIGLISSVTQPFCGDCSRSRLSSEGRLYTCLFAGAGTDLRSLLRAGASDAELLHQISRVWSARGDRYSELRANPAIPPPREKVEMSHIGG